MTDAQIFKMRKFKNWLMTRVLFAFTCLALLPLFCILGYVIMKGVPSLNWTFFTALPKPVGESGGGMANALVGSLILVGLASLIGVTIGIATGLYLSEFGRGKLGHVVRFAADMLSSVPSIVIGVFVYVILVVPMRRFSGLAGSVALAIIMIPTVARNTEELLKMVPNHIREAGLALGLPRWRVILFIVLRGSLSGIFTGVMLAIARVAGETAPLLFTALGNRFWAEGILSPMASLPVQIFTYSIAPFEDWHREAWAGAFVLLMLVLVLNLVTRSFLKPVSSRE